jgi:hypothetical protein
LCSARQAFYVEATAAVGASVLGGTSQGVAAAMRECIERVRAPSFFPGVHLNRCGTSTPGQRDVTRPLQRWLDELDPDEVLAEHARTGELPSHELRFDGWQVDCQAIPVSVEHRDDPDHQVIGTYSEGFSVLDDAKVLRRKLKHKASHYDGLEVPFVVSLLCVGDFAKDDDIEAALLGSEAVQINIATGEDHLIRQSDGFWHGPNGPQNTTVSAVLTIPQLFCSAITAVEPTVWLNPWAARPFTQDVPWRAKEISPEGRITTRDASRTPADLFRLPERWPVEG